MLEAFGVLAAVMSLAALGGVVARLLKQPVMIGYVVAGIGLAIGGAVGQFRLGGMTEILGQLGITLLLFLAGMELPLSELKQTGKTAILGGFAQVLAMTVIGFGVCRLLGFDTITAGYMGLGLAFASTILVVKLLSEKGDVQSLHGKLAVGFLLVQDFAAIGVLVMLSGMNNGNMSWWSFLATLIRGLVVIGLALYLSENKSMGKALTFLAKSTELLFVCAIAWCLAIAFVSEAVLGFSLEIGGLVAGLALAGGATQAQIIARVKPLRDFFLIWFFVFLGAHLPINQVFRVLGMGVILAGTVSMAMPLVVMVILGLMGYRRRTIFIGGLTLSSVSEFSLIVLARAVSFGQVNEIAVATMTVVMILTMLSSTYLIWHAEGLYRKVGKYIGGLERKVKGKKEEITEDWKGGAILFGHSRVGRVVLPALVEMKLPVTVVDFNPEVIEKIEGKVRRIYGDMSDVELYEALGIEDAKLVISTVPDFRDSLTLLEEIKKSKRKLPVIVTAMNSDDEAKLYKAGADYVLVPHNVGGEFLAHKLKHEIHI